MGFNKLMIVFMSVDFLFLLSGGLMLGFALISEGQVNATPSQSNVVSMLLLSQCPLTAAIVDASLIFATFILSLPALVLPQNKMWLRALGWATLVCATFTLILGLVIWFDTLQTRSELLPLWKSQSANVQKLLQTQFNCCGYINSNTPPFVTNPTCPNAAAAQQKQGCVTPFSNAANAYLDIIFTAFFGVAGVHGIFIVCIVMVLKYRQEQERYRAIDEKNGASGI